MGRRNHVSLDLETMSSGQNAAIVSIGAAYFEIETGKIVDTFYVNVDLQSALNVGCQVSGSAIEWWLKQSDCARMDLLGDPRLRIRDALTHFNSWLPANAAIWGNGATFDNRVIREAFDLCALRPRWHYRDDLDMRTIVALAQDMDLEIAVAREGTHHNAMDDAVFQSKVIAKAFQALAARHD